MQTEDGDIIRECLNGDKAAFAFLVDKYKKSVYALAYSRVRNFHDAQDIAQDVFIRAYKSLHTLKRRDNFMGWLYRITANVCKRWAWSQSRRPDNEFIEDHGPGLLDNNSMISYRDDMVHESIQEALESLPESYREVLSLRYFGGMKINEISKFLGISSSTVNRRLREALSQLKEETLVMIGTAKEQHELPAAFMFKIVETVKHIKINPISVKPLPWGLAMAAGFIAAIFGISQHSDRQSLPELLPGSVLSSQSKVLEVGEYPVDILDISKVATFSNQAGNSNGSGSGTPDTQNALFMAQQAGGKWTKKADMPTARFELPPNAAVANEKIYVIGGSNVNDLSAVEEYNPITDKWTKMKNMPTARRNLSTCALNGKIYAIGGFKAGAGIELSTIEEYDPIADIWIKKLDMPTGRQFFSANAVGDKIYVMGGWRNRDVLSTTEEYDPIKDEWARKADMIKQRYGFSASVVNGKIYVIGGCSFGGIVANGETLSTVEEYDPVLDKWTQKADMPTSRMFLTTSVANGKIYAIGGGTLNEDGLWSFASAWVVEEYDPTTDTWTKQADMPTERYGMSSAAVNEKIYVIGGFSRVLVTTVEEYNPKAEGESINLKGKLPAAWGEAKTVLSR